MPNLIPINYNNDRQTVSMRELYNKLEIKERFSAWWDRSLKTFGLQEGDGYCRQTYTNANNQVFEDFEVPIDVAKHICMISGSEKAHAIRQYFIELEKQWNSPDAVMARALKMADTKLIALQGVVIELETENKLLAQQTLEWADRKVIEALVKKYGGKIGYEAAWREFKKELLYAHGINLNLRITNWRNEHGRKTGPKTLDMIHDEEIPACISTAVALCKANDIKIDEIIRKYGIAS